MFEEKLSVVVTQPTTPSGNMHTQKFSHELLSAISLIKAMISILSLKHIRVNGPNPLLFMDSLKREDKQPLKKSDVTGYVLIRVLMKH